MSSRRHFHRSERYECGEGANCNVAPAIIAAAISAGAGYLSSRQQARNARSAMANQAAYAQPRMWVQGRPHARTSLSHAGRLYSQGLFAPGPDPQELWGRQQLIQASVPYERMAGLMRYRWKEAMRPTESPYVNRMVEQAKRGLNEQYAQTVLPRIADQAQNVGGFGGSRQGVAQALASKALMQQSGDIENKIRQQGYGQALAQQRAAFQHAPTAMMTPYQSGQVSGQVGAATRADQMRAAQNLMGYSSAISPYTQMFPGASGYPPQYAQANPWTGAMQGAATGLGLYGMYRDLQRNQFSGGGGYNPSMGGGTLSGPGF